MKITDAIACPWCGEKDHDMLMIIQTGYPTRPRKNVWCSMCNVTGPEGINEISAIEQWNARAGGQQPVASKTGEPSTLASATGYEATLRTIKDAPLTWLGGILACCVEECVRRKFFRDTDAISRFVNRVIEKGKPHNGPS